MQAYLDREAQTSLYTLLERCHPQEVVYLLDELRGGRLDGQDQYGCLIGLIAQRRGLTYATSRLSGVNTWPIERWVRAIRLGDTPENRAQAQQLEQWLFTWLDERTIVLPAVKETYLGKDSAPAAASAPLS